MRINKYLAFIEVSTRRGADALISKRKVWINGRLAVLGDKVDEGDAVEIRFHKKATDDETAETPAAPVKNVVSKQKPAAKPTEKPAGKTTEKPPQKPE